MASPLNGPPEGGPHVPKGLLLSIVLVGLIVVPWWNPQDHSHWTIIRWVPFVSPPIRPFDIAGNVLLYVPFGYAWRRAAVGGAWPCLAFAALLSILTESTQLFSHSRVPSTGDVVCNVLGALMGIRLADWLRT
jgi:glycopeptide antibiotics resistance protein